jgi:tRNA pseudouridine32 synthase/23S rRNA pseudouridine746 synthase
LAHHRWVTDEPDIPFTYSILFENARVIVIDKPHFLATTPRGMWYRNTALIRLREQFNNPDIIAAHRLDRATAGIVLFVKHVNDRRAYQMKFQDREVTKTYECLAPLPEDARLSEGAPRTDVVGADVVGADVSQPFFLDFPLVHRSRIVKERHVLQAYEVPGATGSAINSETLIEFVGPRQYRQQSGGGSDVDDSDSQRCSQRSSQCISGRSSTVGLYRLHPKTGKTHQLRVHMNALGLPICGDDLYPQVIDRPYDDFSSPLQLVASRLQLTDPISGDEWDFHSSFRLE